VVGISSGYSRLSFDGADKVYQNVLDIGFQFDFYGIPYNQFVVGANGWIGFNTTDAGQADPFSAKPLPNNNAAEVPDNCIMPAWQDWVPLNNAGAYVGYECIGNAPDKRLVISYFNVPLHPSSTNDRGTYQVILNQIDNSIETHITQKPTSSISWSPQAVHGLHSKNGVYATTVPGRNAEEWVASYEGKKFIPNGSDDYSLQNIDFDPVIIGELSAVQWYRNSYDIDSLVGYGDDITVHPQRSASYLAVVVLNEQVPYIDTLDITVHPIPLANAGPNQLITLGSSTTLNGSATGGSGTYSWDWSPVSMLQAPVDIQNPTTTNLFNTQIYRLIVTDINNGCVSDSDRVVIEVENAPLLAVLNASANTVCPYDTVELEVEAFGGQINQPYIYDWWVDIASCQLLFNDSVATAIPETSTWVYVKVEDAVGASFTDSLLITVPGISPSISGPSSVCAYNTNTQYITPSTTNIFKWAVQGINPDAVSSNGNTFTVDWGQAGNGDIRVIETTNDLLQCSDTAYLSVVVHPNPDPLPSGPLEACEADSGLIYFTNDIPENSYDWTVVPKGIADTIYPDTSRISVGWEYSGLATILVEETSPYGCHSTRTMNVTVHPLPRPNVQGMDTVCLGDTLFYFSGLDPESNYSWQITPSTSAELLSSADTNFLTIAWKQYGPASIFLDEVNSITGCQAYTDTFNVYVNPLPELSMQPDMLSYCYGQADTLYLHGADLFTWAPFEDLDAINDSTWIIMADESKSYRIVGINTRTMCRSYTDLDVQVKPIPYLELGDPKYFYPGIPFELSAGSGFDEYLWNTGVRDSVIYVDEGGVYSVKVGLNECYAIDSVLIRLPLESLPVPTAFTPNGDGINDVFKVLGTNHNIVQFQMTIFNRFGQMIFETQNIDEGWDGRYNNKACPGGSYVYKISFMEVENPYNPDVIKIEGIITLLP